MISLGAWSHLAQRAPVFSFEKLCGGGGIVVLAPHPDDESLGCGGLLAAAARHGVPCRVVLISDGSKSHPHSRTWPAPKLADLRRDEMIAALRTLGLDESCLVSLDFADGSVPHHGTAMTVAAELVATLCDEVKASALFATWQEDPHHDHQATAAIAQRAVDMAARKIVHYAYPIWAWTRPATDLIDDTKLSTARFPVGDHLAIKQAAVDCHRSQLGQIIDDDPSGFVLQETFVKRLLSPHEIYFRVRS